MPCLSTEKSAVSLMGIFLYPICCFSFTAFNIFSLFYIFAILTTMDICVVIFGLILFETLMCFGGLEVCFIFGLGKFSLLCFQLCSLPLLCLLLGPQNANIS